MSTFGIAFFYPQNKVAWKFDFPQTTGFEDMPMEK